jgi:hypothetical protein
MAPNNQPKKHKSTTRSTARSKAQTTRVSKDVSSISLDGEEILDEMSHSVRHRQEILQSGLEQLRAHLGAVSDVTNGSVELLGEFSRVAELLVAELQRIETQKATLVIREKDLKHAETVRDQGYADERLRFNREISDLRSKAVSDLEKETAALYKRRTLDLSQELTQERNRANEAIKAEQQTWDELRSEQTALLREQANELERQKGAIAAIQSEFEGRRTELEDNERELEVRTERVRQQLERRRENLDGEIERLNAEEMESLRAEVRSSSAECKRLRDTLQSQEELLSAYQRLEQQLGGREPAAVISELRTLNDQIMRQREELALRPSEEIREQLNSVERDKRSLMNRIDELSVHVQQNESMASKSRDLMHRNNNLEAENKALEQRAQIFESAANEATSELRRLRASYETPAEADERYRSIEKPLIPLTQINPRVSTVTQDSMGEIEWLDRIAKSCDTYGLHFDSRILKAFHTAIKTAEWSPITILTGVSGTGKSELPRLYSHFGGLYFEPLSVQPNWDSQESMLGYFNSIDNRFDAQPVLRLLAQSQIAPGVDARGIDYPGLRDSLCLVLLDEMNLAHPELYFAEFLSKLELRRGKKGADVPSLQVKVGSGIDPYQIKLGRNVLWVGTMNQDETTKSLSDKVLDRAIIIYFPRPTTLKRRQELRPLDELNRGDLLPLSTWNEWRVRKSTFKEVEVRPFKSFIEEMNDSLAVAGRAIGHRVWQSVEYYMANHPDVRAAGDDKSRKAQAMHIAFEDQLVQKVMPKLRGIDTRGKTREECLDRIRGQLVSGIDGNGFDLAEDFDLAMDLGYGQFMWQTANYLKDQQNQPTEMFEQSDEPA